MVGQIRWTNQTLAKLTNAFFLKSWVALAFGLLVTACQQSSQPADRSTVTSTSSATSASISQAASQPIVAQPVIHPTASVASVTFAQQATTASPIVINWTLIDSGVKPVDKAQFNYPFALDGIQVKSYMDAYHVDAKTARYNLTVGMAVNEVLSKVLDQVGTAYVSHELTAGNNSQFIIHTTARVRPSEHLYVFEEPFAHGLTMPIVIRNDGKKSNQPPTHPAIK